MTAVLRTLVLLLASLLPSVIVAAASDPSVVTVYVTFGTYNDEGITAWEVLSWDARMDEDSAFDYKDFLGATIRMVWTEDPNNAEEAADGAFLRLLDAPIVFGLDVPCPDPPGWVPPLPEGGYDCQRFKAALEVEVDRNDAVGVTEPAAEEAELELAVKAHVQKLYRDAIEDGTMARKLRDIEGGGGAMRILWDNPSLRTAWRKYGGGNDAKQVRSGSNGDGGYKSRTKTRAVVGGALAGAVMLFFLLAVCVYGRMLEAAAAADNVAAEKAERKKKSGDGFANERGGGSSGSKASGEEGGAKGKDEDDGAELSDVALSSSDDADQVADLPPIT